MNQTGIVKKYLDAYPGYWFNFSPGTYKDKSYLSNISWTMRPKTLNAGYNFNYSRINNY